MSLALKIGFWIIGLLVSAAIPNIALRARAELESIGAGFISEKTLREELRYHWWFMLGIAVLALVEGLYNARTLEGVLLALLFVVMGFRMRQVKPKPPVPARRNGT